MKLVSLVKGKQITIANFQFTLEFTEPTLSHRWDCAFFGVFFINYIITNPFILFTNVSLQTNTWHMKVECNHREVLLVWIDKNKIWEVRFLSSSLFWNMFCGQWNGMDRIKSDWIRLDWRMRLLWFQFGLYLRHFASANHVSFVCNT